MKYIKVKKLLENLHQVFPMDWKLYTKRIENCATYYSIYVTSR